MPEIQKKKSNPWLKWVIIGVVVAAAIVLASMFDLQGLLIDALDWVRGLGPWGPVAFVVIYILAAILFLPGSILTLGAGFLFGLVRGTIVVNIGATLGATAAFLIGRYFARDWVAKQLENRPNFQAIDGAVAEEGWKIVGLLRLSPVFPFNLLNYGLGLTRVSLRDYFFPTWLGILPGTLSYVYLGTLAENLATLGTEERSRTPAEWAFLIVGFLATAAVTIYVTKIARQALAQKTEIPAAEEQTQS